MRRALALVLVLILVPVALATPSGAAAPRPLQTSVVDFLTYLGPSADLAFSRTAAAGATVVRLTLEWAIAAPQRPANPTNPNDPAYQWALFDHQVRLALASGLQPMLSLAGAPPWVRGTPTPAIPQDPVLPRFQGPFRPNPVEFGRFAGAAARRYSGSFADLPRVRLWQAWNEPNISHFLAPQFIGAKPASPAWYRSMLNRFAAAVHRVRRDNVVVTGGLSAFAERAPHAVAIAPLRFMRELLCMSGGRRPKPTCKQRAEFDAWSHHPYTRGGPTADGPRADEVSLGNLGDMKRLLDAAKRAGKVVTKQKLQFWVTEFSWDTGPPDPHPLAVPIRLHGRWVAEALYRMWRAGVSLVTWFQLRDEPYPESNFQSGLFFRRPNLASDQPKPALAAFRFPFVAYRNGGVVTVWGRTPRGARTSVVLERNDTAGWRRLTTLRTDRYGIFSARLLGVPATPPAPPSPNAGPSQYRQAVVADGPTSYWRLGEAAGAVARDEMGVHEAAYEGGVTLGVAGAIPGDADQAIALDGQNDSVTLGHVGAPKTVELWLRTDTTEAAPAFSNRNEISQFSFLGVLGDGNALAFDSLALLSTRWITDGRWHHLVYTHDGATGRVYVDGELDSSSAWSRTEGDAPARLGFDAALKTHLRGALDEVAIYDYPLSPEHVRAHFHASGAAVPALTDVPVEPDVYLRATAGGVSSLPFSLTRPPDRVVLPFGGGGG